MAGKRQTAEQITNKLREAEVEMSKGQPAAVVCRMLGVTEQTSYYWRKEYAEYVSTTPGGTRRLKSNTRG